MKKTFAIAALLSASLLFTGCNNITNLEQIDVEQAKSIALAALEMSGTEISYMEAELKNRNGQKYYDVDIVVDGVEYELDVDALTGVIIEKKIDDRSRGGAVDPAVGSEVLDGEKVVDPAENGNTRVVIDNYTSVPGETLAPDPMETAEPEGTMTGRFVPGNNPIPEENKTSTLIGGDKAFEIACAQVGLRTDEVTLLYCKQNSSYNDGTAWNGKIRLEYDVYFQAADGTVYHIEVDAEEGTVLSLNRSMDVNDLHAPNHDAGGDVVSAPAGSISKDRAIAIALDHAALNADQVQVIACELDEDDGTFEYDIVLKVRTTAMYYTFEIKALSGKVIRMSRGMELIGDVSVEEAKAIVLMQIKGATVDNIVEFEIDTDDGKLVYEGTVVYNRMEYEFEIDGYSGAIRSWEVEPVDD